MSQHPIPTSDRFQESTKSWYISVAAIIVLLGSSLQFLNPLYLHRGDSILIDSSSTQRLTTTSSSSSNDDHHPSTSKEYYFKFFDSHNRTSRLYDYKRTGERFEPGSLNQTRIDTITQCYVGTFAKPYIRPILYPPGCGWSPKYNLRLWYVEKTGTSTQKLVMNRTFEAFHKGEYPNFPCSWWKDEPGLTVTVTRDPVNTFISGLREALWRQQIYVGKNAGATIPEQYKGFMKPLDGMTTDQRWNVSIGATPKDLELATRMFEQFIQDYDGDEIFDVHIQPQVGKLFRADHTDVFDLNRFDYILDAENLNYGFESLAKRLGAPKPSCRKERSSTYFKDRALDTDGIRNETIQKICKLVRTDACCMNYQLPDICRHPDIPEEERVMCEWVQTPDGERRIVGIIGNELTRNHASLVLEKQSNSNATAQQQRQLQEQQLQKRTIKPVTAKKIIRTKSGRIESKSSAKAT